MNALIIYKGKYGATKQYAGWVSKELNFPVKTTGECRKEDIINNDFLVIGSSVYIGTLLIKKWLKDNLSILAGKKIFLLVVCGTPADEKEKLEKYIASSVPVQIRENCSIHVLGGRMNFEKLSWWDKFLMKAGARFSGDENMKKAIVYGYDEVKRENIYPVVKSIRAFMNLSVETSASHI